MKKNKSRSKDRRDFNNLVEEELEYSSLMRESEKKEEDKKDDIIKRITINKEIKFKNAKQKQLSNAIHENQIVFVKGAAGTGKTFIALKAAVEVLKNRDFKASKILLTKPIVEAGESIGFLPGDIGEKTEPYMKSYLSNLSVIIGKSSTKEFMLNKIIESNPIPYLRGDTFNNSIAILDESQNTTPSAMKLFISRIGNNSKMIIIGDSDQTDLKLRFDETHGLDDAFKRLQGIPGIAFIEFTEDDIVRNDILIPIMKAYKKK